MSRVTMSGVTPLGSDDRLGERTRPSTAFCDEKWVGTAHLPPPRVERTGQDRAEQPADLGARDEVTRPPGTAASGVEAPFAVERFVHERSERHRTFASYPPDQRIHNAHTCRRAGQCRHDARLWPCRTCPT